MMSGQRNSDNSSVPPSQAEHALLIKFWIILLSCGLFVALFAHAETPPTIDELLDLPGSLRANVDPAELSLLCTRDLPKHL